MSKLRLCLEGYLTSGTGVQHRDSDVTCRGAQGGGSEVVGDTNSDCVMRSFRDQTKWLWVRPGLLIGECSLDSCGQQVRLVWSTQRFTKFIGPEAY